MNNFYKDVHALTTELISINMGNTKINELPLEVLTTFSDEEYALWLLLTHHHNNELSEFTDRCEFPDPTVVDIQTKNQSHAEYTKKIGYRITRAKFTVSSGEIVVDEPFEYTWLDYEENYDYWYDKVKPIKNCKNGKWTALLIKWENGNEQFSRKPYSERALFCYHESFGRGQLPEIDEHNQIIGGAYNICVVDLDAFGDLNKAPEELIIKHKEKAEELDEKTEWDNVIRLPCMNEPFYVYEHGIVASAPERRGRRLQYYSIDKDVTALFLRSLWSPGPSLFDKKISSAGVVLPKKKKRKDFFMIGVKNDLEQLKNIEEVGHKFTESELYACIIGNSRGDNTSMEFLKYVEALGARLNIEIPYHEILSSGADKGSNEMIIWAMRCGATDWQDAFFRACCSKSFKWANFFFEKGIKKVTYMDLLKFACSRGKYLTHVIEYMKNKGINVKCMECGKMLKDH